MIAGKGTPEQAPSRSLAYRDPDFMQALIDRLVAASIAYLVRQFDAGVDAVQIFESFGRRARPPGFRALVARADPADRRGVRREVPRAKIIVFAARRRAWAPPACRRDRRERGRALTGRVDPALGGTMQVQTQQPVQGNLDPLRAGGRRRRRSTVASMPCWPRSRAGRISSISATASCPETPIENVAQLVKRVRGD